MILERLLEMLGFNSKSKANYVGPDVSRAVQRNEMANESARRALEGLKGDGMSETLREIAGKMK